MGRNSDIVGSEASVESQPALISNHFSSTVEKAVVWELSIWASGLLLQSRLDKVKGQAEEGSKEAGDGRSTESLCGLRKEWCVFL